MTHFFEISPSDAFQAKRKILEKIFWPSSSSPFLPLFFHVPIPVQAGGDAGKAPPLRFTLLLSPKRRREKEKKKKLSRLPFYLACLLAHTPAQYSTAYAGNSAGGKSNVWESGVRRGRRKFSPPPFFLRSCRTRENRARGNERNGIFFANFLPPSAKFPKSLLWFFLTDTRRIRTKKSTKDLFRADALPGSFWEDASK